MLLLSPHQDPLEGCNWTRVWTLMIPENGRRRRQVIIIATLASAAMRADIGQLHGY